MYIIKLFITINNFELTIYLQCIQLLVMKKYIYFKKVYTTIKFIQSISNSLTATNMLFLCKLTIVSFPFIIIDNKIAKSKVKKWNYHFEAQKLLVNDTVLEQKLHPCAPFLVIISLSLSRTLIVCIQRALFRKKKNLFFRKQCYNFKYK